MNTCCGQRHSKIESRNDGTLVTVFCDCDRFIAAQLFDNIKIAQKWSRDKISFREDA